MNSIKVLFLASNPKGTNQLALDEEIRQITSKIRAADYRDSIDLKSAWAVRPDDLLQMLNQHRPQIVHFSGHGSESGEVILTSESGESKPVNNRALQALFTTLKDNIKVVVLNCCYSKEQAKAITQVIDCAVGMSDAIGDKAAITFAASFYRAIGFGRSVKEAFDQGIAALLLEGIPEENTPEILVKDGVDPSQVIFLESGNKHHETNLKLTMLDALYTRLSIHTNNLNAYEIEKAKYGGQMVPRRLEINIEDTQKEIEKLNHEIEQAKKIGIQPKEKETSLPDVRVNVNNTAILSGIEGFGQIGETQHFLSITISNHDKIPVFLKQPKIKLKNGIEHFPIFHDDFSRKYVSEIGKIEPGDSFTIYSNPNNFIDHINELDYVIVGDKIGREFKSTSNELNEAIKRLNEFKSK